ncbi:MAG: hypothetical protein Q4C67_02640, partial [Deinococcus sp.]|nr:hypothetical protein [Deinococcus sp.]
PAFLPARSAFRRSCHLLRNTRYDTGWRESRHPKIRKRIETVFSALVEAQIRSAQTKTLGSLKLRVVLAVLAHNLARP